MINTKCYIEHYKLLKMKQLCAKSRLMILSKELETTTDYNRAIELDIDVQYTKSFLDIVNEELLNFEESLINFANSFEDEKEIEVFVLSFIRNMSNEEVSKCTKLSCDDIKEIKKSIIVSIKETK